MHEYIEHFFLALSKSYDPILYNILNMRCTGNGKLKAILFESINLHSFLKCGVVGNKFVMNIVRTRCRNVETASFLKN